MAKTVRVSPAERIVAQRALGLLDLTSLELDDGEAVAADLCARACTPFGPAAAVCLYPHLVSAARGNLAGTGVRVATVINFPVGGTDIAKAASDTAAAVADGADEVDVVWPFRAWLDGDRRTPQALVYACRNAAPTPVRLKVILETGELAAPDIVRDASMAAISSGADFIKTSTGKIAVGASPEAVDAMLDAIVATGGKTGLKVSGGVRTVADAAAYMAQADGRLGPGWISPERFRFGASGLLKALLATLEGKSSGAPGSGY